MAESAGDVSSPASLGMDERAALEGNTQRLYVHVLRRGFELGAFGGIVIGVPLLIRKRQANLAAQGVPILTAALQRIGSSALWTSAATGVGTAAMIQFKPVDQEGIDDRGYRLFYNERQNRTDRFSQVGVLVGGAVAAALARPWAPGLLVGGAAIGAAAGVLAHVATASAAFPEEE
eukprot:CAMPEP_0206135778 /NCGR_PEP_ID=MMETSP1473-20131121/1045_1 /ASSEMBLY_ACC=CAM_ASM_001109 /TAXON_ID=1461547 /ORGANISM="Stichococcus sp, Strain RCC1054" /LENGTH=175 /DNA_ID=CAMNT_0053527863 /DNA_START=351 /DNA_END=878 /DNA_ORIENTATION=+